VTETDLADHRSAVAVVAAAVAGDKKNTGRAARVGHAEAALRNTPNMRSVP